MCNTTSILATLSAAVLLWAPAAAQAPGSVEARLAALETELGNLRARDQEARAEANERDAQMQVLLEELSALREAKTADDAAPATGLDLRPWPQRITIGGYGESHLNGVEGPGRDYIDHHRVVAYLGVNFTDWMQLHSEVELEHSWTDGEEGYVILEQLYTDFLLHDAINLRAGRVLTPLGIINQNHEPTLFHGVERPVLENVLIPTTWSFDGAGIFGNLGERASYEFYIGGGINGAGFSATNGIRGGRLRESPGVSQPALTGRVDLNPFARGEAADGSMQAILSELRLGASFFAGGVDNGNRGIDPDVDGYLSIWSGDAEWSIGDFDFRTVFAFEHIDDASDLNEDIGGNVAEWMAGYYLEAAWHVMPDAWRTGKLADSDLVLFGRFEDFNTQWQVASGHVKDRRGDREVFTGGVSFFPVPNYVLKADIQVFDDDTGTDLPLRYNFGLGWRF